MRALLSMTLVVAAITVAPVPVHASGDPPATAPLQVGQEAPPPEDHLRPPAPPPPLSQPPVPTPEAIVRLGDTLYALADAWGVDRQLAVDANADQLAGNPDLIQPGWRLKMPGGREPAQPVSWSYPISGGSGPMATVISAGPNRFAYGYCTWYVATRRPIAWLGNAIEWWANARAQGAAEGAQPRPGSIMVTAESYLGHVAYVEAVNADGSWVVSEMNYRYWGPPATRRTLRSGLVPLLGFIY